MQITFTLPDELIKHLLQQSDPETFVREAITTAIQRQKQMAIPASVSRWAKLARRVRENPISLGEYVSQAKQDGQEFRENFCFKPDET